MNAKTLLILFAAYYFFFREKETDVIIDEAPGSPGILKVPGQEVQVFEQAAQSPFPSKILNPESL